MIVFDSAQLYIEEASGMKEKIVRIDDVINGLLHSALKSAETGNIGEYSLDDGQTKIRTVYKDVAQIYASINAFEKLKQTYVNRLNGRVTRLFDQRNF